MKNEDKPTATEQKPVETEADEMTQNPDGKFVLFVCVLFLKSVIVK